MAGCRSSFASPVIQTATPESLPTSMFAWSLELGEGLAYSGEQCDPNVSAGVTRDPTDVREDSTEGDVHEWHRGASRDGTGTRRNVVPRSAAAPRTRVAAERVDGRRAEDQSVQSMHRCAAHHDTRATSAVRSCRVLPLTPADGGDRSRQGSVTRCRRGAVGQRLGQRSTLAHRASAAGRHRLASSG
jgi:hypothetical protein